MLKKSASFVLASLRGSTYRSVRLASKLAAALLDGLFEHPARMFSSCPRRAGPQNSAVLKWFSAACLQAAETARQPVLFIWSIRSVWSVGLSRLFGLSG